MNPSDGAVESQSSDAPQSAALRSGGGGSFGALRHRNYRVFFTGQLISLIGTWMTHTAQGWLVYELTGSKTLLGVVAAASNLPLMLLSTHGGWMADRHPKRTILLCTQVSFMILSLLMAALVWSGTVQAWHVVVIGALGGVVMAFDMPARQSFAIELTSRQDLLNAITLNGAAFNGARIIGPSIAGFLMAHTGIGMCFFVDGISFLAVIAGLLSIRLPKHQTPANQGSVWAGAREGLRCVLSSPYLSRLFFLFGVVATFGWSYSVLMPVFARDVFRVSEEAYGLLLGSSGVGALLGALGIAAFGHLVPPKRRVIGGVWLFAALILGFALSKVLWVAMLCLAGAGFGLLLFFSSANSSVQTGVEDGMRGRVMGIWTVVFGASIPLGALQAGTLAHFIGAQETIILGALLCAIAAAATHWFWQRESAGS
jgi:MFS family permease